MTTNPQTASVRLRTYLRLLPDAHTLGGEIAYSEEFRSEDWPRSCYAPTREDVEALLAVVPSAPVDRDTLRRRFGDVLRHWGLLDEQIDQKAAEEFVVTDLLALLPAPMDQGAEEAEDDGEGDVLVCVDMCGSCDACGMEPFGTPAEGWRQAARFLRRTARDSGNRRGALHGAQLIEDELRRLAEAEQGAAVLRRMAAEEQPATCGAREPEPRTGTSPCVLPAGHGGTKHQDKWTNQWAAGAQPTTGHEVEATTRGGILVEAIEVARQESERLAAEMSGDAAYGARAVAKVLLRRLVGEEQPQSTQDDGIHEPGCASQSYPDPGICYCEDPQ